MLSDLSRDLVSRKISPVELLNDTLARIDKHDGTIRAFIDVEREQALKAAGPRQSGMQRARPFRLMTVFRWV